MLLIGQQMCYDSGENRWVGWVRLAVPPSHPRQALIRLETHPTDISIPVLPGEVTVHELTCHFTSLHSVSLRWVTRKGDRREAILLW
jgi:hypothetical protein